MSHLLGDEFPAFAQALDRPPVRGLRVNTLKIDAGDFHKLSPFPLGERIAWCGSAFQLPHTPLSAEDEPLSPGKHPFHLAGLYYLQDPSAMSAAELLAPQSGERVIDVAASPGGKTTHLASLMGGQGLLVANEIKSKRLDFLTVNVQRWGAGSVMITHETPERLADHFGPVFDRVLVDAPCSGEGTFRRDMHSRSRWSVEAVTSFSEIQLRILRAAARLVKPGGRLLYSTCTFEPVENEGTISRFLDRAEEFEIVPLPQLPGFSSGRPEWLENGKGREDLRGAVRLFPHLLEGDGHFVCLLRRREGRVARGWLHSTFSPMPAGQQSLWQKFSEEMLGCEYPAERMRLQEERLYLAPSGMPDTQDLHLTVPGIWLGTFKKDRFEPAHAFALFLRAEQVLRRVDLGEHDPRLAAYLRGETFSSEGPPGWLLVTVEGWPLGWGKRVLGTVKNHFPRGWLSFP